MKKEYMNVKRAAEYLTLAPSTLYTYIHYKRIPFSKIGERVVFERRKLDDWVNKKQKGTKK
jgi:excisionase family DNA binding protein